MQQYADIPPERRWSRGHPCPVCAGHPDMPQGRGTRCWGFLSGDREFFHCTREEYAGRIPASRSGTYAHRGADCLCGVSHLVPAGAAAPPARERTPVKTTLHEYRDADGALVAVHKRIEYDDGSKSLPWVDKEGNGVTGIRPESLPLYGLPDLLRTDAGAPIFFTEGEKAADALRDVQLVGLCCGGGADQTRFGDAFAPLRGRTVFLIPDNDRPGAAYMRRVSEAMTAAGADPILLPLPGLPPKGDAYEYFVDQGHTADDLRALALRALDRHEAGIRTPDPARYRWNIVHVSDYLAMPHPKPSWLVKDRLLLGGTSLLVAKAKVGKSTLSRELMYAVLRGEPWRVGDGSRAPDGTVNLIEQPVKRGAVIYFPMEEHTGVLSRMLTEAQVERLPLYLMAPPAVENDPRSDPEYDPVADLESLITEMGVQFVVLDPIADWLRVKDFNSYAEVREGMMRLTRVARRTNAHIMALHHSNKSGQGTDGILGSAALSGAVDTMLLMRRIETTSKEQPQYKLGERYLWSVQRYGTDLPETRL